MEVAIALGVVSFGVMAVLGTLPVAMGSARESIDQTRASEVADSLFASFRSQPFNTVCYVDDQFAADGVTPSGNGPNPIDLRVAQTPAGGSDDTVSENPQNTSYDLDNNYLRFFAAIDQTDPTNGASDPSRVHYTVQPPMSGGYQVILHFTSAPAGVSGSGLENRVEMLVSATNRPTEYYRFTSTIANCSGTLSVSQL